MSVSSAVEQCQSSIDGQGLETLSLHDPAQDAEQRLAVFRRQLVEKFGIVLIGQRCEFRVVSLSTILFPSQLMGASR